MTQFVEFRDWLYGWIVLWGWLGGVISEDGKWVSSDVIGESERAMFMEGISW